MLLFIYSLSLSHRKVGGDIDDKGKYKEHKDLEALHELKDPMKLFLLWQILLRLIDSSRIMVSFCSSFSISPSFLFFCSCVL